MGFLSNKKNYKKIIESPKSSFSFTFIGLFLHNVTKILPS